MTTLAHKLKPAARVSIHLFLAALTWTIVGAALLFFGVRWVLQKPEPAFLPWLLIPALVIGFLKARFVLVRAGARITTRIIARGDGRCLGGFLAPKTWLLVLLMMGGGRLLRAGWLPLGVVGLLYAGVGTALLIASFKIWSVWSGHNPTTDSKKDH